MYNSLGSRDVHHAANNERRAFDRSPYTVLDFTRMESPSDFECLNVRLVDMFQRGVSLTSSTSTNTDPIGIGKIGGLAICNRREENQPATG